MANIIADKMIFPELIQSRLSPKNLANEINKFIANKEYYNEVKKDMKYVTNIFMEKKNAIDNVSSLIIYNIDEKN